MGEINIMNMLITGGAGFIGSHLSERLISEGHRVICFDDFSGLETSYDHKWKNINGIINNDQQYRLVQGDIREKGYLAIPFEQEKIDIVIHLAAKTGVRPSVQDPILHSKVNILGTINVLQFCVQYKIKNLIFASSSSIYGNNPIVPFSEETKADTPLSPYAATKKAGENMCYVYHKLYGLNVICLRLFTVYGPRQRKEMAISSFTKKIYNNEQITLFGNGENKRDYTYVDDIVDGFIRVLNHKGYEIYNIASSNPISLFSLISLIEAQLRTRAIMDLAPMQPGEADCTWANITKASIKLGYKPQIGIKEGLTRYVDWYLYDELKKSKPNFLVN